MKKLSIVVVIVSGVFLVINLPNILPIGEALLGNGDSLLGPILLASLSIIILTTLGVPVTLAMGVSFILGLAVEYVPFLKGYLF